MVLLNHYGGRKFSNSQYYYTIDRQIIGIAKNKVWLYTVEYCKDIDEGEIQENKLIRLQTWRARVDSETDEKYWQPASGYNIRTSERWEKARNTR